MDLKDVVFNLYYLIVLMNFKLSVYKFKYNIINRIEKGYYFQISLKIFK